MGSSFIPYGAYWSTPFSRWQGAFSGLHSLRFAAYVARRALQKREIDPGVFDLGLLGTTIPQSGAFYGMPWLMSEIGADEVSGPTVSQACATGVRLLEMANLEIRSESARAVIALGADRTSNGPHIYYPAPDRPGGTGEHENWVLDNFNRDPITGLQMIQTGENVVRRGRISTARQNEVTLRRYEQYADALKDDSSFLRRFMDLPFDVPDPRFSRTAATLDGDEGVFATTAEGLAKLKPVLKDGTITYGGQTHPADGSAAMVVATRELARKLSRQPEIEIELLAFGHARVERGFMPMAPVPAAARALQQAGLDIARIDAIKTHNPFVVNDIWFAEAMNLDVMKMNNFGSSLVWGHPQGPTGLRGVIELIEELAGRGGGLGLFTGCAAGDTGMAVVLRVTDGR